MYTELCRRCYPLIIMLRARIKLVKIGGSHIRNLFKQINLVQTHIYIFVHGENEEREQLEYIWICMHTNTLACHMHTYTNTNSRRASTPIKHLLSKGRQYGVGSQHYVRFQFQLALLPYFK